MEIKDKEAILRKTHYGLNIYAHILRCYYPEQIVLSISGRTCAPARNPFNGDKPTLLISVENNIATHRDSENAIPAGDVFSFAELHYKQSGNELLQTLITEMNLHIGENFNFYTLRKKNSLKTEEVVTHPTTSPAGRLGGASFSFFKAPISNTIPHSHTTLYQVFNAIKGNYYEERTTTLRAFADGKLARLYKAQNFDYCTFSGVFSKRNDSALIQHSGLLTLDFDHVSNLHELRETLLQDRYFETELLFVSPSGDGLKWIIPIDLKECSHQEWFQAIAAYIKATYKLEVDKSGKDISRACFLPNDPRVYINPNYLKYPFSQTTNSNNHATK